jgi:hypothetical protein
MLLGLMLVVISFILILSYLVKSFTPFMFLPPYLLGGAILWENYKQCRRNMETEDDEAFIGLLDEDEVLDDGLDLYAVRYKDDRSFELANGEGRYWRLRTR